ncbi:solute carrier family 2 [Tropilaelaps mercedesae]|uniref:Solute carrier family 2 n=1 Tax=Tropilaelaps mercedesae TaxID=418985 RepID=A0A1V9X6L2_9ACAR|nr:solute carrier family 2 [Tropilaelaps mercedesae]
MDSALKATKPPETRHAETRLHRHLVVQSRPGVRWPPSKRLHRKPLRLDASHSKDYQQFFSISADDYGECSRNSVSEAARTRLGRCRFTPVCSPDNPSMSGEHTGVIASPVTVLQVLRDRSLQLPLLIGVVMHLSQQLSGINAVSSPMHADRVRVQDRRPAPGRQAIVRVLFRQTR